MTRKYFKMAAEQIKCGRGTSDSQANKVMQDIIADEFCNFFQKVNPRFDRAKFIKATY